MKFNVAVAANLIVEADSVDQAEQIVSDAISKPNKAENIIFSTYPV